MELTEAQAITERLSKTLAGRRPGITKSLNYFKGNTGQLRFASGKFEEYFNRRFDGFTDNWCMPVAQAPAERMNFLGVRPYGKSKGVDRELERAWSANDAEAGSSEAFLVFGVTGRAFSLVSPTSDPSTPRLTWEHPESAITEQDPFTGEDRYGLLVWADDGQDFAQLMTPVEVWKFKRPNDTSKYDIKERAVDLTGSWIPIDDQQPLFNPLGEVPLSELRNQTLLDDEPMSDIAGVAAMQDAANLVWAYLLNGLDSASLPARVVTGADLPEIPVLDDDGNMVGSKPVELDELMKERILWVPGENASIAEWSAGQLDVFSAVIERIVEHIAAQTRTPPHYLVAKMVNTAAESLNIAEAGLVSKTGERITYANRGIKKTQRLMAKAQGADAKRLSGINAGKMIWDDIQYRSDSQIADAVGKYRAAGMPIEFIAEKLVKDPTEVRRIMKMIEAEAKLDPLGAAQFAMQTGVNNASGSEAS